VHIKSLHTKMTMMVMTKAWKDGLLTRLSCRH